MATFRSAAAILLVLLGAGPCAAGGAEPSAIPPLPPDLSKDKVLYVVATSHLDTQWRWTYQETIRANLLRTLKYSLDLFDKYPHYTLSFEGAFRYALMKEYYPQDYARLKEYVARGRWVPCGNMLEGIDTNLPSPESLFRQILYGRGWFKREFGTASCDVFLPDSFGFTWALPTVAAHCGLKGFSTDKLSWGAAIPIPFDIGAWEGPDGATIVAALKPGTYMGDIEGNLSADKAWLERIGALGREAGVWAGYRYIGVGDTGGAPKASTLEWLEKSLAGPGPIRVLSAPSDRLYRDLTPADVARLPRHKGELLMSVHGTGCYTSQAAMKRWNRRCELLADAAERACVAADRLGGAPYPQAKLTEAWTRFLAHQAHDDLPGNSIPQAYVFSWNDEVLSLNQFAEALTDAVGAVSRGMDTRAAGVPLVVYNPVAAEREDVVEALVRFPGGAPAAVHVIDPSGREVPAQLGRTEGGRTEVLFLARVPSVGFKVFDVRPAEAGSKEAAAEKSGLRVTEFGLENTRFIVKLDASGDVAAITDKMADRELLAGPARIEMLADESTRWPAWEIQPGAVEARPREVVGGPAKVRIVEGGPVRAAIEVTRQAAGSQFVQRIRLADGGAGDRVEFDTRIDWRTPGTLVKAAFPLSVSSAAATYDLGLGVAVRPTNTRRQYEVPAQQWADLADEQGGFGISIINDCKYGWDKPSPNTLRLTLLHTPAPSPYYDDEATQDFGRHRLLYAVTGHFGDWRAGGVVPLAARINQPLLAFQVRPHEGALGTEFSLLRVGGLLVSARAIKKAEEGDAVVVRLQETRGENAKGVTVGSASPVMAARELTGTEEDAGPAKVVDGALVVDMKPWQPCTFALTIQAPRSKLEAPVSRPLTLPYDLNVVSADGEMAAGDVDGRGRALPAELFPRELTVEGIRFVLGPSGKGEKNALFCRGQSLPLDAAGCNRLYVLACAAGADAEAEFAVDGKPVTLNVQSVTGLVGQWDSRVVDGKVIDDISKMTPAFVKRAPVAWIASHVHTKDGKNEPYVFGYLFKLRLDLPPGAKSLTLPKNETVRLFAITAAHNENDDTEAACVIYD
jgi:alpha-mannosidase